MNKIYAIALLSLVVFFSACEMQKRHYRNGYYVNWNGNNNSIATPATETVKATLAENGTASAQTTVEKTTVPVFISNNAPTTEGSASDVQSSAPAQIIAAPLTEENVVPSSATHNLRQRPNTPVSSGAADDDKVLLIILAILLPPLAMYLYEGSWTRRCWVNLLLTLLCGLPGMIHALVVIIGGK